MSNEITLTNESVEFHGSHDASVHCWCWGEQHLTALRTFEAMAAAYQDISHVTEYGMTQRLQNPIRVF